MSSSYVNDLRLEEIGTGDQSGTWGTTTNTNLELIGEALGYGTQDCFTSDADATTTVADGATDPARSMYFKVTSSATLTATRTLTIAPNTISRVMFIENATTGSQSITISQGSGANVTIATGKTAVVYLDGAGSGAAVVDALALVDPGVTDTLAEVLVAGNTSGGTGLTMSSGDDLTLTGASYNVVWDSSDSALEFADNAKAVFGAGSDLEIFSDGTNGRISLNSASGNLRMLADEFQLANTGYTNFYLTTTAADAVLLYHGGSAKLETTSTGIDVTGTVTADGLTVDGLITSDNTSNGVRVVKGSAAYYGQLSVDYVSNDVFTYVDSIAGASFNGAIKLRTADNGGSVADRVIINSTGVGIGTTSPNATLHVIGPVDTATISTSSTPAARINNGSAISNWIGANGYNYGYIQSIQDDGTNNLKPLALQPLGGNVGIGTTSPSALLHIASTGASNIKLEDTDNGFAATELNIENGGRDFKITTPQDTIFVQGSTEAMRIDTSGNVGIGTTSPSTAKLQVKGAGTTVSTNSIFAENSSGAGLFAIRDNGDAFILGNTGIGTSSPASELHVKGSTPDLRIENTTASETVSLSLIKTATKGFSINNKEIGGTNYLTFNLDTAGAGTDAMVIHPTSGNVGIGTTSPGVTLDINRATSTASYARIGNGGNVQTYMGVAGDNLPVLGTYTNHPLRMNINTLEVARFDTSGNLLVGCSGTAGSDLTDGGFLVRDGGQYAQIASGQTGDSTLLYLYRKDGSSIAMVGSIGNESQDLVIDGSASDHAGLRFMDSAVNPRKNGALSNGAVDLGGSIYRWKDLHLSGVVVAGDSNATNLSYASNFSASGADIQITLERTGSATGWVGIGADNNFFNIYNETPTQVMAVSKTDGSIHFSQSGGGIYLGTTTETAANKLDDYEEGTWTPTFEGGTTNPTVSYSNQTGRYTKVGNLVTLFCQLRTTAASGGSGTLIIAGLPFNVSSQSDECGGSVGLVINLTNSTGTEIVQADATLSKLIVLKNTTNSGHAATDLTSNTYFRCTIQYTIA